MEICPQEPRPRERLPSIIEVKNKIRQGHIYDYTQYYYKSDLPLDDKTTYKMSFWPGPRTVTKAIVPQGSLTVCEGPFTNETTHKMSYLGNWCVKPQEKILPCVRNFFGRGPIQDKTVQKCDFTWKCGSKAKPIKYKGNLCLPRGSLEDNTTYKLSYYESACREPVKSYAPIRRYEKSQAPVDDSTTYRLSFFQNEPLVQEKQPWKQKPQYHQPTTPVDECTTYKLSYWPQDCPERVQPIKQKSNENILNKACCFDDNTTYGLSYYGGADGDRPRPVVPPENQIFDDCPISHDTVNRMSYVGNWCPKPEKPILPCARQLLGRGPIQECTTQKCDFTWKCVTPEAGFRPEANLELSRAPFECCTTNRLSYMPNCSECLLPNKSYAPIRKHEPSDVPMDLDTTMQLSYQPVGEATRVEKPWAEKPAYHKPTTNLDDNTTYNLSYIPPGTLEPCCPEQCSPCSPDDCSSEH
ncbi:hypothetical protein TSAR_015818 [Trichomalopsis sarcophagae]|uniref:Uncharacterized protein n=1 Tax=Trichomalopsis sarcophagae TaxID=543379 RepID=A0A232F8V4_9HYME|nr:hypothetical protein TSAR_015818 [Trichomalopsis sarcophagae]